jgi:hypothetical protein
VCAKNDGKIPFILYLLYKMNAENVLKNIESMGDYISYEVGHSYMVRIMETEYEKTDLMRMLVERYDTMSQMSTRDQLITILYDIKYMQTHNIWERILQLIVVNTAWNKYFSIEVESSEMCGYGKNIKNEILDAERKVRTNAEQQ